MARDTKSRLTAAEKRAIALKARIEGKTYDKAAEEAGYANRAAARKAVQTAIADVTREPAKELLELELLRLDEAMHAIYQAIKDGDVYAIDRLIKIMDMRAKLTGLYNIEAEDDGAARAAAALVALVDKSREAVGAPPLSTPEPASDDDQENDS